MKCPACGKNLSQLVAAGVVLDACNGGCGGIWFDAFELQKVEAAQEVTGDVEINIPRDPSIEVDQAARRNCPKCPDVVLMRHFYSKKRRVVLDECPSCAGFWLDAGELESIRSERESLRAEETSRAIVTRMDVKYTPQVKL
jgi:Zn-finger nucleic acid-binding protein